MSEDFIKSKFIPGFLSAVQAGILGSVGSSAFDLFPEAAGTGQARCLLFIKLPLILNIHHRREAQARNHH